MEISKNCRSAFHETIDCMHNPGHIRNALKFIVRSTVDTTWKFYCFDCQEIILTYLPISPVTADSVKFNTFNNGKSARSMKLPSTLEERYTHILPQFIITTFSSVSFSTLRLRCFQIGIDCHCNAILSETATPLDLLDPIEWNKGKTNPPPFRHRRGVQWIISLKEKN